MKNSTTKYVGLDVSKEKIAVAIADEGREPARYWGMIPHEDQAILNLLQKCGRPEELLLCYEAGPTGYPLVRFLMAHGYTCVVIAPSLTPNRPGDRVKTDRRDALRLAQLLRAGELSSVHVPTPEEEALRDLVRMREDIKEERTRIRQRIGKMLLRHQVAPKEKLRRWTQAYRQWLGRVKWTPSSQTFVWSELLYQLDQNEAQLKRMEAEIHREAQCGSQAPLIQALQTLRGIAETTATGIVAEVCSFERFVSAKVFMGYTGLVPREYSSGSSRHQGGITKTGNTNLRKYLVEAAWSYRYVPAVQGSLKKRQEGQNEGLCRISWKAQQRLNGKYTRMCGQGKAKGKAVVAVARELAGFIWALAKEAETLKTTV
ncbi:IS110 family transposase [Paenibacillus sp. P96]|uniref:IS110 family transposase n=1 Tax=Paenibacillus zeirhizosphaerae TaxID=2987519 RepID=A0ABT9FLE0_9BACL|nr:IS110 family transposase [Paenibacillus sp. P96]MDP4095545.1 IS110 family transposase [Paenibacillus sp. P96]